MQVRIIGISRGSIRIWGISTAISEEPQVIVNERDRMGTQFPEPVPNGFYAKRQTLLRGIN
jgi:hypothetical protein